MIVDWYGEGRNGKAKKEERDENKTHFALQLFLGRAVTVYSDGKVFDGWKNGRGRRAMVFKAFELREAFQCDLYDLIEF